MKQNKKVLIITYYWPPASGPGVQRFLKISKYLNDFGWKPIILTVKNGSYPSFDPSLENEIPEWVEVYKTKTFEPFAIYNRLTGSKGKNLGTGLIGLEGKQSFVKKLSIYIRANYFIPDARKGWYRYAVKKAKKLIQEKDIDAIITTGPPHSTHLIGKRLKRKFNLPWIADFRDPWVNIFYNKIFPRTIKTEHKDRNLENLVLSSSDYVTAVSKGLRDEFSDRSKNIEIIYNGFDPEDIPDCKDLTSEKFVLSYIGNFKPSQNIEALWQSIEQLKSEIKDFAEHFVLNLTGNIDPGVKQKLNQYKLHDVVELNSFVKHKEATKLMVQANMLLFVVPKVSDNHLIITGKLFEYIASGTPLLSIGPEKGNAAEIINNVDRGEMIDYDSIERIKQSIKSQYVEWLNNDKKLFKHELKEDNIYSRKYQAKQFAEILDKIATHD